jgi:GT2 family glycosyltransferase
MPGTKDVDVVIVVYGNAATIEGTVAAVSSLPDVESVVVVDHGTDGSGRPARRAGALVVEDPTNPGFGAGVNHGATLGRSPFLLLLNPDAELEPGALRAGLTALADDPGAAAVEGVTVTGSTGELERAGGKELGPLDLVGRAVGARRLLSFRLVAALAARVPALLHQIERGTDEIRDVETLSGAAMLVRRDAFEAVGGFDERFFLYGEDLDLCRRLRARGWRLLYLPVPWAVHENGSSSASSWMREVRWWEGTMRLAAQWWGDREFGIARAAAFVRLARLAVRSPRRSAEAYRAMILGPSAVRRAAERPWSSADVTRGTCR